MIRIDSHAPLDHFEAATTTSTTNVVTAPIALITIDRRHPFIAASPLRPSAIQCFTMPDWDSVNEVNTPTT